VSVPCITSIEPLFLDSHSELRIEPRHDAKYLGNVPPAPCRRPRVMPRLGYRKVESVGLLQWWWLERWAQKTWHGHASVFRCHTASILLYNFSVVRAATPSQRVLGVRRDVKEALLAASHRLRGLEVSSPGLEGRTESGAVRRRRLQQRQNTNPPSLPAATTLDETTPPPEQASHALMHVFSSDAWRFLEQNLAMVPSPFGVVPFALPKPHEAHHLRSCRRPPVRRPLYCHYTAAAGDVERFDIA
jgi:hypothetical protein